MSASTVTLDDIVAAHRHMRERNPLVQCLTNTVSVQFVANALLAAGAAPAMVDNPEEAAGFAGIADAVLVNLGTPTAAQVESSRLASAGAREAGKPWVLDPVGAGGLPWRTQVAVELLTHHPSVIRANASEVMGLAGARGASRGVDSSARAADSVDAARSLLDRAEIVAASGDVDHIVGQGSLVKLGGGSALLQRVTATGCALGALTAAYCSVAPNALIGAVAAHAHVAVASEIAARSTSRPGSFAVAFLDGLDTVDESAIRELVRLDIGWPE
uniref:hydroxyethylthiazole kinase n=1 Tax=unclassified Rhodococcus (in: high G+C Gram-positive bacteria) TaxID=192944 RepID=UPI0015952BCE|nr:MULTISPECIES: hydroxyethylthiazole kinase [unclassified Rhodococcus (in: high G+C Gram-positive bacteria)]